MNKKIISFVLCLTLLFGNLLPIASAEESNVLSTDDVFVENTESVTEPAETEAVTEPSGTEAVTGPSNTEAVTEPVATTVPAETVLETQPQPTETDEEDAPAFSAPACDCGSQSALIIGHSDVCAMKQFYKDLCAGTASDIYALWNEIPKNAQAYIMTYLGYAQPETLKELVFLLASKWENESGLSGVAAAIKDGILFGAFGIPEDAVLQIKDAAAEAKSAIEAFIAQQENVGKELFTWDISVLNGEGISWQPDGSVRVELELPGEKLHKHTQVYVVHVDDEGNAERIEAEVIDGNKIAFNTNGFSTFAGFTVDFEYDGMPFSIPVGSEIMLSELMDELKMPFEVADVVDVTFTNYDLIAVEKLDGDWKLTSLVAFQTEEALTLIMTDGKVYEIKVTDAEVTEGTHTWHVYNGYYATGVNHVYSKTRFPYGDSYDAGTGYNAIFNKANSYSGWNSNDDCGPATLYFDDSDQVTTIILTPRKKDTQSYGKQLVMDMFTQIMISNGANVTIQLDEATFNSSGIEEVIIRSANPSIALFYIVNGTLTLKGTAKTKIVLDYGSSSPTNNYPLIYAVESTKNIYLEHVKFRNSRNSGIGIKANEINTLSLKDCEFESTVNRVKIDGANYAPNPYGGAIHVWDYYDGTDDKVFVDVVNFYLERVKFNGNTAGSYGGAIATYGRVYNVDIVDCDFLNCKAKGGNGGAIFTCGIIGTFDVTSGTYFENCTATQHGGAVNFMSLANTNGNYSTANNIKFTECAFKNCRSTDSYGGAISIASQTNKLEVLGCTFTDCKAYADGGAISMYSVALSGKVATGTAAPTLAGSEINDVQHGTVNMFRYAWDQGNNQVIYRTTVDTFTVGDYTNASNEIKHTTFTDCVARNSGGGICIASGSYIKDVDITNAQFNRCRVGCNGNAVMLVTAIVEDMDITGSTFENCTAIKAKPLKETEDPSKDLYTFDGSWVLFRKATIKKGIFYYKIGTNRDYVRDSAGDPILYEAQSDMEVYIRVQRDDTSKDQLSGNGKIMVGVETATYRQAYQTDSEGFYVETYTKDANGKMTYASGTEYIEDGGEASGTIRTTGATTCILDVTNCIVRRNVSKMNGGGLYWNANTPRSTVTTCTIKVTGGEFYENYAERDGGGIYCESTMTVSGTTIHDNVARCGGGIAQQVYSNAGRMMADNEKTDLTIQDNTLIYSNYASMNGGGISILANPTQSIQAVNKGVKHSVLFNLNGSSIYNNTAKENGGGVSFIALRNHAGYYDTDANGKAIVISDADSIANNNAEVDSYTKSITITEGHVYGNRSGIQQDWANNKAETTNGGNGGGIYMESSQDTTLAINSGSVYSNTAVKGDGGGIYMTGVNALCSITGGTIGGSTANKNHANKVDDVGGNGGGIAISGGASIEMKLATGATTGGIISYNKADRYGGGIWLDARSSNGVSNKITITEGQITNNTAATGGGGIFADAGSNVKVSGGLIHKNTAASGGGIFVLGFQVFDTTKTPNVPIYDTYVTVEGGTISENVANGDSTYTGMGGGIHADRFVDVQVKKSTSSVGKITGNSASRGGGVYVCYGAKLTVSDGHITHNKAETNKTNSNTTTYQFNHDLYGVGGGIYVADGNTANGRATFILDENSTNIAIYGNTAEFAADDVFASGKFTKLSIPAVSDMNLAEYDAKPKGWFEDYCIADTCYTLGTEKILQNKKFVNGDGDANHEANENWRYKGSPADKRILIPEHKLATAVNAADAFVCMTLGAPVAVDDVIVADYGIDAKVYVLDNDLVIGVDQAYATLRGIGFTKPSVSSEQLTTNYQLPASFNSWSISNAIMYGDARCWSDYEYVDYRFTTMVVDKEGVFYYAVEYDGYVYYAKVTVIPATTIYFEDSGPITYSAYAYNVKTDQKVSTTAKWEDDNSNYSRPDNDYYQDMDRPGEDVDNKLGNKDMDSNYGYDKGYSGSILHSWGKAKMFTASQSGDIRTVGEAKFTFKGTGFDVIGVTSGETGTITVQVSKNGTAVKNLIVDTYYGYTYSNGTWTPVSANSHTDPDVLYQVPVIKCTGLPYDTYDVTLTVSYVDFFDHALSGSSYDFYLDAIRIYDPANDGTGNKVIQDAYVADNEGWPEYIELRNLLLNRSNFDNVDSSNPNEANGIVFIDGRNDISNSTIADYMNYGPNNELYLAPGQSIAFNFALPYWDTPKVASVQIGLKSVGGSAMVTCYGVAENVGYNISVFDKKTINTATDMYYDITPLLGRDIVITNPNVAGNAILSITNIKVTYKEAHTDYIEKGYFPVTKSMATFALRSINQYYADLQAQMSVDLIGATLSFEDEVYTNLYYTTTSLDGAAESDMGLLTWSSMPEDATFENAENVFEGAVYNADNGRYMVRTDGIASKNLGDDIYMRPYVKLSTGNYVYGDLITYSPKQYAMSRLENSSNEKLKALCVAMLNYGAAAQTYFGYKTDVLANADLTAEQQALVSAYSADLFRGAIGANAAKVGEFAKTETGFGTKYASVSFESAFAINYYFAPTAAVDSDVTMYYWTADAYASADTLTAENASGALTMVSDGSGNYWAQISGIAAKQLDETYYVAAVYTSNGETFCTGVIAYSLSGYCMRNANGNMGELAQATAMYGYYAQQYFG